MAQQTLMTHGENMNDTNNDAAAYQALEREMAQPSEHDSWAGPGEPQLPIDRGQLDHGQREQDARHEQLVHGQQPHPQQQQYGLPIAEEDPIGHFTARANAVEGHLANQNFWNHVQTSEAQIRKELGEEHYDAACQHLEDLRRQELAQAHPDHSPQMQAAAHRFGMSPAQLREHML